MSNFDDYAAELEAAHAERLREHEARLKREEIARTKAWGTAQRYLEAEVIPLLEEAKTAYERRGFRVELNTSWSDGRGLMCPEVSFQVVGQKRLASGISTYEVSGDVARVCHDGTNLTAAIASGAQYRSKTFEGSGLDAVREVARRALASAYEALDPAKR